MSNYFEQNATIYTAEDESVGIVRGEAEITTNVLVLESDRENTRKKLFDMGEILLDEHPTQVIFFDECPDCGGKGFKNRICVNKNCINYRNNVK